MGSAPNAAATANVSHPAKQGFVQALGVFFDTIIICTTTAVMILLFTSTPDPALDGIQITQVAMAAHIGDWAQIFVAIAIFLFAFSSIIGNYYYGETNIEFLSGNRLWITLYRWAVLAMVLFGSISGFQFVWNLADLFMGAMAITNLIAIMLLAGIAIKVLKNYTRQRKEGKDPVFQPHTIAGLKNVEAWDDHYKKETDK